LSLLALAADARRSNATTSIKCIRMATLFFFNHLAVYL